MEPRIQYAKTSDGVSIGYWTLGEGAPLVVTPGAPHSPTLRSLQSDDGKRFFRRLASNRRVIRYDNRGFGNSQRDATDTSLDAWIADLAAVVDRLDLDRFALLGYGYSAPIALAYASRYHERVSELIIWCGAARGADAFNVGRVRAARAAVDEDPEFFLQVVAQEAFGWSSADRAKRYVARAMEDGDARLASKALLALLELDITSLLNDVAAPTLLLHRRNYPRPTVEAARFLTASLPDARLVVLEGDSGPIYLGDTEPVLRAIDEFLDDGGGGMAACEMEAPGSLRTIAFTDLASSTALTQRLGDVKAQELVRAHNTIVREALAVRGGSEIKHTGDGIMASFGTASGALECAVVIQRAVAEQANADLAVHVGLNAGEPVAEESDLYGTAVQLARRICDAASGGEILASNVVRELAAGKGFLFADRGETALRGFEDPVRLYEVRWREGE